MGSSYLARITDFCSDMAVVLADTQVRAPKVMREAGMDSNSSAQDGAYSCASASRTRSSSGVGLQGVSSMRMRPAIDHAAEDYFFSAFAREIDLLREWMTEQSSCSDPVSPQSSADEMDRASLPRLSEQADAQTWRSVQDAVTDAIGLLAYRTDTGYRRR